MTSMRTPGSSGSSRYATRVAGLPASNTTRKPRAVNRAIAASRSSTTHAT
nr:hypothetical protein [Burkholderia cepacia]